MCPPDDLPAGYMKPIVCGGCGTEQEGYTGVTQDDSVHPSTDDVLVCVYCAAVNVMQEDGSVRTLSRDEANQMMADEPALRRAVQAARLYRAIFGDKR